MADSQFFSNGTSKFIYLCICFVDNLKFDKKLSKAGNKKRLFYSNLVFVGPK